MKKTIKKQCDELWSEKIKERADNKCEKCGNRRYVQAHHIIPRTNYALRYDLENGVALCRACHLYWAHKDTVDFYDWVTSRRDIEYLKQSRHRQSKNDYQAIKIYLEGI